MEFPDLKIRVVTSPDDIAPFWEWLTHRPKGYVCCDVETGAGTPDGDPLQWFRPGAHVRMMQFGDTEGGWAIPMQGWPALVEGAFDWIRKSRTIHVWHNGYDYDYKSLLHNHGIKLDHTTLQDTYIWAGLRGYAEDSRKLKDIGRAELGDWAGAGENLLKDGMKNGGWNWTTVPMTWMPYPIYGVMDTCITAFIYEKWEAERIEFRRQHELEIAAGMYTNGMSLNGMAVDGTYVGNTYKERQSIYRDLYARAQALGLSSPTKNQEILEILRAANVLDETIVTDGGDVSVNKKQLYGVGAAHPLAQIVLDYRWEYRVAETYLKSLWDLIDNTDAIARVHPSIWSMEARTGRMSVSNPAVQQFPASDPTVRNSVVPRNPGEVLIAADFSQIEMRLWGFLNGDQALIDTFNEADATGGDFFAMMGTRIYNDPGFKKSDPRRGIIKPTSYCTIFAGGPDKIAETAGVPLDVAMPVIWALREQYKSFADVGQSMITELDGGAAEVHTPTGRRFRVRSYGERRKLPNYVTQGHAAEILKGALVGCGAAGLGDNMVLAVHDELIFSVPKGEAEDAKREIKAIMDAQCPKEVYGLIVPAQPVIADRWGGLKG